MVLRCPKCENSLNKIDKQYVCDFHHSYDIAKSGYVNLVLANQKHSENPGDNDDSLRARNTFLNNGYYEPLACCLAEMINKYIKGPFLDAGCGTGYYLNYCFNHTSKVEYYACDLAKKGVEMASKQCKEATCFVGNLFHLPIEDKALSGLMSVFTPYSAIEFSRVIKDNGYVISVTPTTNHLLEIKQVVYNEAYLNEEHWYDLPDFKLIEKKRVNYIMHFDNTEDILTLWRMTPYFHTTNKENNERLEKLEKIDCQADFLVCVYQKNEKI